MRSTTGRFILALVLVLVSSVLLSRASAHYLWVTVDPRAGEHGTTNVVFEGGTSPGDGQHLDPFIKHGKTWIRTVDKPVRLKLSVATAPGKRWLSARLPSGGPQSIDSYGKWGVYRYGKIDVLLHYYARHIDFSTPDDLKRLARAPHLALEVVPRSCGESFEFQVLWRGKPAAGSAVAVRGPNGFKASLKTGKQGIASFKVARPGRFTLHTIVEEKDKSGTDTGKKYDLVRHHGTLVIRLPAADK